MALRRRCDALNIFAEASIACPDHPHHRFIANVSH
jgi:hypothetical protein